MSEELTVVLHLWEGWRPVYDYRHVNAMVRMLKDYLYVLHDVVCFTDTPKGIICPTELLQPLDIVVPEGKPNSYCRLRMFSPWAAKRFSGKMILSIDLDAVILKPIDPLNPPDLDFKINKGIACAYNGGMWLLRPGTRNKVWSLFSEHTFQTTQALGLTGSDQAWLSHILPGEATWGKEDGVYHFSHTPLGTNLSECRIMFFAGAKKPWSKECRDRFFNVYSHYREYLDRD